MGRHPHAAAAASATARRSERDALDGDPRSPAAHIPDALGRGARTDDAGARAGARVACAAPRRAHAALDIRHQERAMTVAGSFADSGGAVDRRAPRPQPGRGLRRPDRAARRRQLAGRVRHGRCCRGPARQRLRPSGRSHAQPMRRFAARRVRAWLDPGRGARRLGEAGAAEQPLQHQPRVPLGPRSSPDPSRAASSASPRQERTARARPQCRLRATTEPAIAPRSRRRRSCGRSRGPDPECGGGNSIETLRRSFDDLDRALVEPGEADARVDGADRDEQHPLTPDQCRDEARVLLDVDDHLEVTLAAR